MKAYELMSLLEQLPAGKNVKVNICLTFDELAHGQLEEDSYILSLDIDCINLDFGTIETTI